jgi:hypothetical protein
MLGRMAIPSRRHGEVSTFTTDRSVSVLDTKDFDRVEGTTIHDDYCPSLLWQTQREGSRLSALLFISPRKFQTLFCIQIFTARYLSGRRTISHHFAGLGSLSTWLGTLAGQSRHSSFFLHFHFFFRVYRLRSGSDLTEYSSQGTQASPYKDLLLEQANSTTSADCLTFTNCRARALDLIDRLV